jgi:hypothetical protein
VVTPWPVQNNHQKPLKKTIKPVVRHTAPRGLHHTQSERGKTLNVLKKTICLIFYTFTFKNKDKLATDYQKIQSFYSSWIECLRLKNITL